MNDRSGERYGQLVIIQKDRVDKLVSSKGFKYNRTYYLCECDCGKQVTVVSSSLGGGNTKSCGCLRSKLLTDRGESLEGQVFGRLTVVSKKEGIGSYWNCVCECGGTATPNSQRLKSGNTRSCGCIVKENAAEMSKRIAREYRISAGLDPDKSLTSEDHAQRQAFKTVSKEIYKRDSHTCVLCSNTHCMLNAHHIETWASAPDLRFDKDNVITLCLSCHKKVHDGNYNKAPNAIYSILLKGYSKVINEYLEVGELVYDL